MGEPQMEDRAEPTPGLQEYRQWLVAAEQKSQEEFDKAVLSLSGGALGISFVFLKDVVGSQPLVHPAFLLVSWVAWGLSALSVLASYYLSHLALRRAIVQVDDGSIFDKTPGGAFAFWTAVLNAAGAVLFVVGVCCITVFAGVNLPTKGEDNVRKEASISTPERSAAAASTHTDSRQGSSGDGRIPAAAPAPAAAQ